MSGDVDGAEVIMAIPAHVYLIGSLENAEIPNIAKELRAANYSVFDDWFAAGPDADKKWREYEEKRGRKYKAALEGAAACNVFQFDHRHLSAADIAVLALPAGKSGHLELGWALGQGKPGFILLDRSAPPKWDVMYKFATGVAEDMDDLLTQMRRCQMRVKQ